jgi:hypothetical protein
MYGSEMHMASNVVVSSSSKMLIVGPGLGPRLPVGCLSGVLTFDRGLQPD